MTGVAMAALGACGFATKGIFAKLLYASGWDFEGVITVRALLALPVLWAWALWQTGARGLFAAPRTALAGAACAGLFCYYAGALYDFRALMLIDASIERVLLFAYPSMVVVMHALLYREPPRPVAWISLALTYAGILLVVSGFDARILSANLHGSAMVLFCAFTFATYYLASDRWARSLGSVAFTVIAASASTVALTIHYIAARGLPRPVPHWTPHEVALIIGLVALATVLPMVLMAEGVRRLGAPRASVISTVGPPATIFLGALLLHERLTPPQWAGVALIAAGILVLELQGTQAAEPA